MRFNIRKQNKKAEMQFWLVMLIVALVFGMVILVLMTGGIAKIKQSLTRIQVKTTSQADCLTSSPEQDQDGDGWHDTNKFTDTSGKKVLCDKKSSDPFVH